MHRVNDSPAETDRVLVAQFVTTRDEASFHALYCAHTPALYLLALRLAGRNPAQAEDVVQEAWLRAVRGLEGFRWESSLRTWLSGIVVNCWIEIVRHRRPGGAIALSEAPEPAVLPSPAGALDLESFLKELPDGYREVVVLHDMEGYTHEEIGRLLGISAGTSKSQLSRARRTLRAWLNGQPRSAGGRAQ
jgi:RNA polymerase sigma-70 factor (ECF subfamily)